MGPRSLPIERWFDFQIYVPGATRYAPVASLSNRVGPRSLPIEGWFDFQIPLTGAAHLGPRCLPVGVSSLFRSKDTYPHFWGLLCFGAISNSPIFGINRQACAGERPEVLVRPFCMIAVHILEVPLLWID